MKSSSSRQRFIYLLLAALTICAGLVLRRVPMGLPVLVVKYGGSLLWAAMVYWIAAALCSITDRTSGLSVEVLEYTQSCLWFGSPISTHCAFGPTPSTQSFSLNGQMYVTFNSPSPRLFCVRAVAFCTSV